MSMTGELQPWVQPMARHHAESLRLLESSWTTRSGQTLTLRHCRGNAELEACVALQRATWGYDELEVTPAKSFLLAQELGGQVIGGFDAGGALVGFAMSMAAIEPGFASPDESGFASPDREAAAKIAVPRPYLHSHMLAVAPEYRNQGLGVRLKLAQREDALARGITRMTWTFDPMQAANAYLNLHRLGAIARRYSPNFYGVSSSRLQNGLPTDRLHAEWWLASERVEACAQAALGPANHALEDSTLHRESDPVRQTILLAPELERWKQEAAGVAKLRETQDANRVLFLEAFASGLAVTDFERDGQGGGVFRLTPWHPRQAYLEDHR